MYCKFCGKEIDENVSFCQYCGGNIKGESTRSNGINIEDTVKNFKSLLEKLDFAKFMSVFSVVLFILSIIIRFTSQEVITVQYFLAYDDYYVLSASGKFWILFFVFIQAAVLFACNYFGKKHNKAIKMKYNILPLIAIIIEIILAFLQLPAPY